VSVYVPAEPVVASPSSFVFTPARMPLKSCSYESKRAVGDWSMIEDVWSSKKMFQPARGVVGVDIRQEDDVERRRASLRADEIVAWARSPF
jgi:hypothetical protein